MTARSNCFWIGLSLSISLWLQASAVAQDVVADPDPLTDALLIFREAAPEVQTSIITSIRERVEASQDPGVRTLLSMRDKARKDLDRIPFEGPRFFEPKVYAPVQSARSYVAADTWDYERQRDLMRPWESDPPYWSIKVFYSYGDNKAWELPDALTPEHYLQDFFLGFPPDVDVLAVWLERQFDHDKSLDKIADHFAHAYCDRVGNCYAHITIYDAFASQSQIEMSDVDVIAFARNVQNDRSFVSPIPGNAKRQRLYDDMKASFTKYFQHRTLCEAAARIYVSPDCWIRPDHEGLRRRLWYLFALDKGDISKVRTRLVRWKDRDSMIEAVDVMIDKDKDVDFKANKWASERNAARFVIADLTKDVLRERGFLRDR